MGSFDENNFETHHLIITWENIHLTENFRRAYGDKSHDPATAPPAVIYWAARRWGRPAPLTHFRGQTGKPRAASTALAVLPARHGPLRNAVTIGTVNWKWSRWTDSLAYSHSALFVCAQIRHFGRGDRTPARRGLLQRCLLRDKQHTVFSYSNFSSDVGVEESI